MHICKDGMQFLFPEGIDFEKEANNSNNKIHKPVSIIENRNNPVGLKYRKKALTLTTKSTCFGVFASWFSVNYKDDHRQWGGHWTCSAAVWHPANKVIPLY